ncbi:MAG: Flp family type IVb pilin [Quisquiliibacterium sp.]
MRLHTSSSEKKAGPRKQRGLATIEYALIASMIAVSGALAANTLSANLGTQFNLIASAVVGANGAINNDSARPGTQIMSIKSWQACPDSDQDKQDQGVRCRLQDSNP